MTGIALVIDAVSKDRGRDEERRHGRDRGDKWTVVKIDKNSKFFAGRKYTEMLKKARGLGIFLTHSSRTCYGDGGTMLSLKLGGRHMGIRYQEV